MDYKQEIRERAGYILIICSGRLNKVEEFRVLAKNHYDEITRRKFRKALVDMRELYFPMGLLEHIDLINFSLSGNDFPEMRKIQIALVLNKNFKETGDFWETFSVNRGFFFRAFFSREEAVKWIEE
jgi:hypothetical protein